jgi:regulator of replication initiation timing
MQNWEEKISAIEQKIYKLVKINDLQQQNYAQLLQSEEALVEENEDLRQQLADAQTLAQTLEAQLTELRTQIQAQAQPQMQQQAQPQEQPPAIEPTKIISDQPPAPNVQPQAKATLSVQDDTDFAQEKEFIKKQISQYIRDIDATVSWIQSLAAPTA